MIAWIAELEHLLEAGRTVVMVTIVVSQGSAPREAGARMLVHDGGFAFTVGGGKLEYEALAVARDQLEAGTVAGLHHFTLGPDLGQCCGGSATMLFELFSPADAAWVAKMRAACEAPGAVLRRVSLGADGAFTRDFARAAHADAGWQADTERALAAEDGLDVKVGEGACTLIEALRDPRQPVWLFGAGHVGRCIAQALAPLPFRVSWVDGREDGFPDTVPTGIRTLRSPMPHLLADEAPDGTMFLVMTHSHAIDEEVCEAVLRRGDFAYLGLIGSDTKSARIRKRLAAKGLGADLLDRMITPIGLAGLKGKEPAVIAASVAVDLLLRSGVLRAEEAVAVSEGGRLDV